MEKVILGNTGESVSSICLGAMLMGSLTDQKASFEMLDRFLEAGGNFIDTANCYAWWTGRHATGDESETLLGRWMKLRGNRERVFLATKAGARLKSVPAMRNAEGEIVWDRLLGEYEYLSPAVIRKGIEGSLRRLQTEVIDLYYTHIDDRSTPLEDTLEVLDRLVREGKIRHLGCSNHRTWRMERSRAVSTVRGWKPYAAIQQEYSYLRPKPGTDFGIGVHADDELMDYLRENEDVTLLAYSPLLKGIYDDRKKRESSYNWHIYDTEDTRVRLETLSSLARELGVSNSQLVLAWLRHHRPKVIPILGARTLEQFEQCMQSLAIRLTDEQMAILSAASA